MSDPEAFQPISRIIQSKKAATETKWEWQKLRQIISWSWVHVTFEGSWAMIISLWVLGPILHYNWMMHGFNLIALSIKTCRKKTRCTSRKRMSSCRKSVLNVLTVSYNSALHYVLGLRRFFLCICLVIPLFGRTARKSDPPNQAKFNEIRQLENNIQQESDPLWGVFQMAESSSALHNQHCN